jgi:hypothetical protein
VLSLVSVVSKVVRLAVSPSMPPVPAWASSPPIPMTALFKSQDPASSYFRIWAWNNSKGGPAPAFAASIEELALARFTSRRDLGQRGLPAR